MGFSRVIITLILCLTLIGCSTVTNVISQNTSPFGGVGSYFKTESEEKPRLGGSCYYLGCLLVPLAVPFQLIAVIADFSLSFVGDTLTLPYTVPYSILYGNTEETYIGQYSGENDMCRVNLTLMNKSIASIKITTKKEPSYYCDKYEQYGYYEVGKCRRSNAEWWVDGDYIVYKYKHGMVDVFNIDNKTDDITYLGPATPSSSHPIQFAVLQFDKVLRTYTINPNRINSIKTDICGDELPLKK